MRIDSAFEPLSELLSAPLRSHLLTHCLVHWMILSLILPPQWLHAQGESGATGPVVPRLTVPAANPLALPGEPVDPRPLTPHRFTKLYPQSPFRYESLPSATSPHSTLSCIVLPKSAAWHLAAGSDTSPLSVREAVSIATPSNKPLPQDAPTTAPTTSRGSHASHPPCQQPLSERCSQAALKVLRSDLFVLAEANLFIFWWVYNFLSPQPFDQAPALAGMGILTTLSEEFFGTFDVMSQKSFGDEQAHRIDKLQAIIEQNIALLRGLALYRMGAAPPEASKHLEQVLHHAKEILKKLELSQPPEVTGSCAQDLSTRRSRQDSSSGRLTDWISRNLRSPPYPVALTVVLVAWMTTNLCLKHPVDPYPFPNLNTLLCAVTILEFSVILKVMKRRATQEQATDAVALHWEHQHLRELTHCAQQWLEANAPDPQPTQALPLPDLPSFSPTKSQTAARASQLTRCVNAINRGVASYPYMLAVVLATSTWLMWNSLALKPLDETPTFPALNLANAVLQEYYSSLEVIAQNSNNAEESRLCSSHQRLTLKALELSRHLLRLPDTSATATEKNEDDASTPCNHPSERRRRVTLNSARALLQDHNSKTPPQPKMRCPGPATRSSLERASPDALTDFVATYLKSWGYLGFLTLTTATWLTANSLAPEAIDPYPFVAFNIGLTVWITLQESFVIRIMLRQNELTVLRRQELLALEQLKLQETIKALEKAGHLTPAAGGFRSMSTAQE